MKQFNYLLIICATLIFLLVACNKKKEVEANFRLNKYEYAAGDLISYENLSKNYETLKWEISNSKGDVDTTFEETNPNLILSILADNGEYAVKLTAENKKRKSIDEKTILIKSEKRPLTITRSSSYDDPKYKVFVDRQYVGESGSYGTFGVEIPVGLRLVEIISERKKYSEVHEFKTGYSVSITF